MTDLPGGTLRTSPIAGSLDGFDTDLRTALARLDRERRSSFARPGQRAEALDRFTDAVAKAVGKVRGADRVAAQSHLDAALDRAAVVNAKTVTALERQLALAVTRGSRMQGELRKQLAARDHIADALRDELTEARASHSASVALGRDAAPEATRDAGIAPDGPRNDADATGLPVRTPGKSGSAPRRTGRPGAAK